MSAREEEKMSQRYFSTKEKEEGNRQKQERGRKKMIWGGAQST